MSAYQTKLILENITTHQVRKENTIYVESRFTAWLLFLDSKNGEKKLKYELCGYGVGTSESEAIYRAIDCFCKPVVVVEDIKEYSYDASQIQPLIHSIESEITDNYKNYFFDNFKKSEWIGKCIFLFKKFPSQ
jgi:hypothetical protein